MEFDDLWIKMSLFGLFVFCAMAFIINFQSDNNYTDGILNNSIINKTYLNLGGNLSTIGGESQTQRSVFDQDNPTSSLVGVILFSIVAVGRTFANILVTIFTIFVVLPATFLGIPPQVVAVIEGLIILGIIFGLWRKYRVG